MKSKRVFVSVGTHPQQFNRLLSKVDDLIEQQVITGTVLAQTGESDYIPKHFKAIAYMGLDEFESEIEKSDYVISHGGEGNIGLALKHKKKCIVVPRYQRFGEHTNDHQIELTKAAADANKIVAVWKIEDLENAVVGLDRFSPDLTVGNRRLIEMLEAFFKN